jgi:iron complex outermembrane recepter protein
LAIEAGFKASGWGNRATLTGAVYRIAQSDILTRDPTNPALSVQGGRQSSRGIELTGELRPVPPLRLTAGASYVDARYDQLSELVGGVRIDRSGNQPINVPDTTLFAAAFYTLPHEVTLGGILRQAGGFYTDTANSIYVAGHALLDASLSLPVGQHTTLTFRGRNLTNRFYGEYSGYPTTNIYIGAPRSFDIALTARL